MPTAQPAAPTFAPLYLQIKALLEKSLEAREWRPGEAIPSEIDLARRYRVSQGTVRKAIDALAADNLVVRRQGKGTFVSKPKRSACSADRISSAHAVSKRVAVFPAAMLASWSWRARFRSSSSG